MMEAIHNKEVERTLSMIERLELRHPARPLLVSFVTGALSPVVAARYVSDRLMAGEAQSMVSDWVYIVKCISQNGSPPPPLDIVARDEITRRDGGRCCVTGKSGTIWDPLIVVPILPVPCGWVKAKVFLADMKKTQIFDMLGAFFSPSYRDWWLSYARDPKLGIPHQNHWLVRKSAAKAFNHGLVKLDRLTPSMIEYVVSPCDRFLQGSERIIEVKGLYPLLGDHSRSGIKKVDARFVGTHARLSKSIRYLQSAKSIEQQPSKTWLHPLITIPASALTSMPQILQWNHLHLEVLLASMFLTLWVLFPSRARIAAYKMLRKLGEFMCGKSEEGDSVQRLPFGLYLKCQGEPEMFRNEFNSLQMVRQHTSIPVPIPLDVVSREKNPDDTNSFSEAYLLITRLPGAPLSRCQELLSDADFEDISHQMKDYLQQLRDIPKAVNPDMAICNSLGQACTDHRIQGGIAIGPFRNEAAFSQNLRFSNESCRRDHKIVFTHADLNPRNILVDEVIQSDGRAGWSLTGIVDWETAGYYPEYWDFTKSLFEGFRWTKRYNEWVKEVFGEIGEYGPELDVETRSWESGDGV